MVSEKSTKSPGIIKQGPSPYRKPKSQTLEGGQIIGKLSELLVLPYRVVCEFFVVILAVLVQKLQAQAKDQDSQTKNSQVVLAKPAMLEDSNIDGEKRKKKKRKAKKATKAIQQPSKPEIKPTSDPIPKPVAVVEQTLVAEEEDDNDTQDWTAVKTKAEKLADREKKAAIRQAEQAEQAAKDKIKRDIDRAEAARKKAEKAEQAANIKAKADAAKVAATASALEAAQALLDIKEAVSVQESSDCSSVSDSVESGSKEGSTMNDPNLPDLFSDLDHFEKEVEAEAEKEDTSEKESTATDLSPSASLIDSDLSEDEVEAEKEDVLEDISQENTSEEGSTADNPNSSSLLSDLDRSDKEIEAEQEDVSENISQEDTSEEGTMTNDPNLSDPLGNSDHVGKEVIVEKKGMSRPSGLSDTEVFEDAKRDMSAKKHKKSASSPADLLSLDLDKSISTPTTATAEPTPPVTPKDGKLEAEAGLKEETTPKEAWKPMNGGRLWSDEEDEEW